MKKNLPKKYALQFLMIIMLAFGASFMPVKAPPAHADLWAGFVAEQLDVTLTEIIDEIKGAIVGALKQVSVSTLVKQVSSMVSKGGKSGPMFITDYKSFLFTQPQGQTKVFINDYISQTTGGRSKISQYKPANSSEGFSGGGGSYMQQLSQGAKSQTSEYKNPQITYTGNPTQMFAKGNFKDMSSFLSPTEINNAYTYDKHIGDVYQEQKRQQEQKALVQAIAGQGFTGKTNDKGKVMTPGITVKDMLSAAQDAGNKVIGGATHVPEVISSLVTSLITKALSQGIGTISSQLDKQDAASGSSSCAPYCNVLNSSNGGTYDTSSGVGDGGGGPVF